MSHASPAATAILALMRLRGIGRRGALKALSERPQNGGFPTYIDWLMHRADRTALDCTQLRLEWERVIESNEISAAAGIHVLSFFDEGYPDRLRSIPDPPAVLFVKGKLNAVSTPHAIAIVGTREPTSFGASVAQRSAATASKEKFAIVSGLAVGCDTYAHTGCVESDGIGIAVLAHGLDKVFPAANRWLADKLLELGGCLVSEYPLGVAPAKAAFAERDRIQSGLADAVFVIETDIKGGTMHTVRFAQAQKRPLACVMHPEKWLDEPKTRGNQMLITDRVAKGISNGDDLLGFLNDIKFQKHPSSRRHSIPLDRTEIGEQKSWAF